MLSIIPEHIYKSAFVSHRQKFTCMIIINTKNETNEEIARSTSNELTL